MRNETTVKENSAAGLMPNMPWRVREVRPLESYRLYVCFADGLEGYVDMSRMILGDHAGVFAVLKDPDLFRQVFLDHGAVTWPNEIDLAPDAMHDEIKIHGEWVLT